MGHCREFQETLSTRQVGQKDGNSGAGRMGWSDDELGGRTWKASTLLWQDSHCHSELKSRHDWSGKVGWEAGPEGGSLSYEWNNSRSSNGRLDAAVVTEKLRPLCWTDPSSQIVHVRVSGRKTGKSGYYESSRNTESENQNMGLETWLSG